MIVKVEGMMCGHCKKAVTEALIKEGNINSVEVNLDSGEVKINGNDLDRGTISKIIASAGYKVV